ncbi:MAG TPA: hypothetical protein VGV18_07685, partial [Verrucomicrobiae bacterium]|nr:hypothetical protein [Verrucomicrobiae bacterium]
ANQTKVGGAKSLPNSPLYPTAMQLNHSKHDPAKSTQNDRSTESFRLRVLMQRPKHPGWLWFFAVFGGMS